jgi:hypothetical protein
VFCLFLGGTDDQENAMDTSDITDECRRVTRRGNNKNKSFSISIGIFRLLLEGNNMKKKYSSV